jgi:hypothetical protein
LRTGFAVASGENEQSEDAESEFAHAACSTDRFGRSGTNTVRLVAAFPHSDWHRARAEGVTITLIVLAGLCLIVGCVGWFCSKPPSERVERLLGGDRPVTIPG